MRFSQAISDKKLPNVPNATIDYFVADITSSTDNYPFGSPMDGRAFSGVKYRFGFNGKENDNEVKGEGNSVDFGARICDSRLGIFLSIDPRTKERAWMSPYNYCQLNPIMRIDPDRAFDADFGVTSSGEVRQIGPTNNEPDRLYAINDDGTKKDVAPVTVNDKKLLPQIVKIRPGEVQEDFWSKGDFLQAYYGTTTSSADATNVFDFVANNSKAEWVLQGSFTGKGNKKFIIGTLRSESQALDVYSIKGFDKKTCDIHIHSHGCISQANFTVNEQDISNAEATWEVNPKARYYVYMPKLTKATWNQ